MFAGTLLEAERNVRPTGQARASKVFTQDTRDLSGVDRKLEWTLGPLESKGRLSE